MNTTLKMTAKDVANELNCDIKIVYLLEKANVLKVDRGNKLQRVFDYKNVNDVKKASEKIRISWEHQTFFGDIKFNA